MATKSESTEELLRDKAHRAVDSVVDVAKPVSKWIDKKTQYLSAEHERVSEYVSAHPIRSMAALLVLGILIGRIL